MANMPFELLRCAPTDVLATLAQAIERAKDGDRLASGHRGRPDQRCRRDGPPWARRGHREFSGSTWSPSIGSPSCSPVRRSPTPNGARCPRRSSISRSARCSTKLPASTGPSPIIPPRSWPCASCTRNCASPGAESREQLTRSRRGREAVRVSNAVTRILRRQWYDEADLFAGATERLRTETVPGLDQLVLHLPSPYEDAARRFVEELATTRNVAIVSASTGDDEADAEPRRLAAQFVPDASRDGEAASRRRQHRRRSCPSPMPTTKCVLPCARSSTPREVRSPASRCPSSASPCSGPPRSPYARLVEHHLTADGIAWNGPGGTELVERIAPRLLLELLGLDRRGLQRRALFEFLADLPVRDEQGRALRTGEWERVSRVAGAERRRRLGTPARATHRVRPLGRSRHLTARLRHRSARPAGAADRRQAMDRVGRVVRRRTPTLARPRRDLPLQRPGVPGVGSADDHARTPALARCRRVRMTRHEFRTVLEAELTDVSVREGRIGTGVTDRFAGVRRRPDDRRRRSCSVPLKGRCRRRRGPIRC